MTMGRPRCEEITTRQAETMQEICRYFDIYGKTPSMQEIGERFGIAAPTVYIIIQALVSKGYLKKNDSKRRPYEIVRRVETESIVHFGIPLLGEIPCGPPEEPFANGDGETVLIDSALAKNSELFALRLKGNSMIDIGYIPGDIVVIKYQPMAGNGDIVAAMINGETTLKRLIYTPDRIALKAENLNFKPIEISCRDSFRIIGKVISHIKQENILYGREQSQKI